MARGADDTTPNIGYQSNGGEEIVGASSAQVIEPEQFHNEEIYRIYLSSNLGITPEYRDNFRAAVLEEGDLIVECCDREIDLSKIMGRIRIADAVIIAVNGPDSVISNHTCASCVLNGKCEKSNGTDCSMLISEFEYYYAKSCDKEIRYILFGSSNGYGVRRDARIEKFYEQLPNSIKRTVIIDNKDALASVYRNFRSELKSKTPGLCIKNNQENDGILRVLNKCVQLDSVPQTIGQYTITSGEMNANGGSEIHILTNEMCNYDFTPMSSLTIAINTQKGVQYYYYGTKSAEENYNLFKDRISDYYEKSFKARRRVVAWIRQAKFNNNSFNDFFSNIYFNRTIRSIVTTLLLQCGQQDKLETILQLCEEKIRQKGLKISIDSTLETDRSRIDDWISAKRFYTDESKIYKFIENLSVLIDPLKSDTHISNKAFIRDFLAKLEALNYMALLTRWQASTDENLELSESEIEIVLEYFKYKDNIIGGAEPKNVIISEPIEAWLRPKKGELIGNENDEFIKENIKSYLKNIHFCLIEDNNPFVLGFNFVLFFDYNPKNQGCDAAAWYTTYVRNDSPNTEAIDNTILMVDIDDKQSLYKEIQNIYKQLIISNGTALSVLKDTGSIIVKRLGIEQ